jgi:hypothetical protein
MARDIKFSSTKPKADRVHWITEEDVRVVLGRLPPETWRRLKAVHFNDMSHGVRMLGYVTRGHKEIAICALAPRASLTRFLDRGQSPKIFGAKRNAQWPPLAIRRFLLYDVFLHELGHLQVVDESKKDLRRKYAMEAKADEFAAYWRGRMFKEQFGHPDPVHRGPSEEEFAALEA